MSKFTGNIIRLPAVTPTQNSASGVYTLDDQFTAQSSGTWPIVRDQYFNYTTLLLTGAVQGTAYPNPVTQPYSFLSDASTNNFVVSPNGDVSARPFNPYLNNYSNYFIASSGLRFAHTTDFDFSTGSFTVESFIYPVSAIANNNIIIIGALGSGFAALILKINASNQVQLLMSTAGSAWDVNQTSTSTVSLNTWSHIAVVRNGSGSNNLQVYVNGTSYISTTYTSSPVTTGSYGYIGTNGTDSFLGYISNARIVKGQALSTGSFTPPTIPISSSTVGWSGANAASSITGTVPLVTCQSNRFIDTSSSPKTITILGTPAVSQNSPFVSYDTTNGSGYFDGTGDYLDGIGTAADWAFMSNSTALWSLECWLFASASGDQGIIDTCGGTSANVGVYVAKTTSNTILVDITRGVAGTRVATGTTTGALTLNAWNHLLVTYDQSLSTQNLKVYINNGSAETFNKTANAPSGSNPAYSLRVGGYNATSIQTWNGYISNLRISNVVRSASLPTTPYSSDANTKLLTLQTRAPATNNGFIDSSPNNFVVTRNGNTTQGSFSPFSQTGWGAYFDGSNDYVSMPDSTAFTMGNGDFTIECWVYKTTSGRQYITGQSDSTASTGSASFELSVNASNKLVGSVNVSTTTYSATSTADFPLNTWKHVAFVRNSGTTRLYIGGEQDGTNATLSTNSINDSANQVAIGRLGEYNGLYWNGYISNLRITKGGCLYPNGTTFTPSITPLTTTVSSGTVSLLTCQNNRFIDNAANTLTPNNGVAITPFSPFAPAQSYIPSQIGGSGYFDGTGTPVDYLNWSGSTIGSSQFCFECWFYATSGFGSIQVMFGPNSTSNGGISIRLASATQIKIDRYSVGESIFTVPTMVTNQWYHLVACRDGSNNTTVFLNGTRSSTGTISDSYSYGNAASISYLNSSTPFPFTGYIAGARLITGSTPYDPTQTTITVPTAPPTAVPNTSLLLNFTNGGIVDATGKNNLETVGNSGVQTTQAKWSPGSIYIPKVGTDYLKSNLASTDLCAFGSGDFVIEFWLRLVALPGSGQIAIVYDSRPSGTNGAYATLYIDNATLKYYVNTADRITGSALSINTWYYIAVARASGNTRLYIDGTQQGSTYSDSTVYLNGSQRPVIGTSGNAPSTAETINGYIDDLRVTKGSARGYSGSTITVPTGPFPLG